MRKMKNCLPFALLLVGCTLALGCDEMRVDKTPGWGGKNAAPVQRQKSAVQQAEERAAAATQRLQDAQNNANATEQEKEDAARQFEAERQAITNASESQSTSGDSAPPPQ
jgi:hypothetical protein